MINSSSKLWNVFVRISGQKKGSEARKESLQGNFYRLLLSYSRISTNFHITCISSVSKHYMDTHLGFKIYFDL